MKKYRMRLWQFIPLVIVLVALPLIMFLPFYAVDKNVLEDTIQDVVESVKEDIKDSSSEYKDELLNSWDENISSEDLQNSLEKALGNKGFDDMVKESEKTWGVDLSSVSGWKLLNLKVDLSLDDLVNELQQTSDNPIARFAVNSVASSFTNKINDAVNETLFPIRLIARILFIICLTLLILLVLTYVLHWNKFIAAPIVTVFGGAEIYFAVLGMWIVPGGIGAEVSGGFNDTILKISDLVTRFTGSSSGLEDITKYGDFSGKLAGKAAMYYYENILSVGFMVLFILGIFTVSASVVTMVLGNRGRISEIDLPINYNSGFPIHVPGLAGVEGMYAGADIALEYAPISVGRNPILCQLVVDNPLVNDKEFEVSYNVVNQEYLVEWNAMSGWFENPLPPGSAAAYEINSTPVGMTYRLRPGTRICIAGGQEVFLLK